MAKSKKDQSVVEIDQAQNEMNPFPGLRPFSIEESHLFFGREGQSEEVLHQLSENRFVAVIGASGSGKSSLMYCGLVPILYGGFIAEAGSEWKIITTRPGNHPIENLAASLAASDEKASPEDRLINRNITLAILQRSSLGLVEAISQMDISKEINILLMVDQFEELFRFKRSRRDESTFNESEAFVKLLVEAINQLEIPIYMVLTMRSDFIGECSQFQDLTSLINRSNYLIPQMTRDDFRDAITGPVAVGHANIDPNLIQQLLNDVGDNPDQLPILQHAMMRTWDYWMQQKDTGRQIAVSDYNAVGRMEKALSEHANEAFEELSPKEKSICESMFKTLTDKGGDNIGIRRPTRVEIIADIARAEPEEIIKVVEVFRAPGRSFLAPAHHVKLDAGSVIDVSHESLMRIWDRLKLWVDEEAQAVNMYKRLSDASELFQRGKTGLWRPPDLQLALNWKRKQQPTLTWAEQYNPAFERTMVFLDTSEKDFIAEEENKIRLQKRSLKRSRIFAGVLGTAAIVSIGLMLWSFVLRGEALKATNEALFQRAVADTAKENAILEQQRATEEAERARIAQLEADSSANVATIEKIRADSSAQEAIIAQGEAETSAQRATAEATRAEQEAERATEQQRLAIAASEEAKRNQTLSTAQSMAVKSLQVDNDNNLKALLAFQSYLFNLDNDGIVHHADIYLALHDAALAQKGEDYNVYPGHNQAVRSLVFKPGTGIFFSASSDGKVLKWDINNKDKKSSVVIDNQLVNRILDISNDGKWLACGTEGKGIQLFDISRSSTGNPTALSGQNSIRTLDFMPDNRYMLSAGANDNRILKWDLNNNSNTVFTTMDSIQVLAVSTDGKWVAGGTVNGKLVLIEADNPSNKTTLFFENRNEVLALSFSPDGKTLASGDKNGNVKIWDVAQKNMIINLRGHSSRISNLKFGPDGTVLASTSFDHSVRLWDATEWNNQPFVIQDNAGYVFSVTFSPDGNYIMSGSADSPNRLVMNPTKTEVLARDICDMVERNFTQEEWETYVGTTIEYQETCGRSSSIGVRENQ